MTTQAKEQVPVVDDLSPLSPEDAQALEEEVAKEVQPDAQTLTMREMRKKLEEPIPDRLLKTMKNYGGSGLITYLHWTTVKKYLDHRSPGWRYYIRHVTPTEIGVAVAVEIQIPCSDGVLVESGIGFEPHRQGRENKPTGFGGAPVVAERQALKRAASMAGLGFSLYQG